MAVHRQSTGKWLCECYPAGREGRRVRKQFATKGEALAFERFTMEQVDNKPWLGEAIDRRKLSEVAKPWYNLHGQSLTAGERTCRKLCLVIEALGDPPLPPSQQKTLRIIVISVCPVKSTFQRSGRTAQNP